MFSSKNNDHVCDGLNGLQTSPESTAWTADGNMLPMRMRSLKSSH